MLDVSDKMGVSVRIISFKSVFESKNRSLDQAKRRLNDSHSHARLWDGTEISFRLDYLNKVILL